MRASASRIELNGRPPSVQELAFLGQVNYGHFTSMQVVNRAVRGFGLHLQRLASATIELFGTELDTVQVRDWVRQILNDEPTWLRVSVHSLAFDRAQLQRPMTTDVLIAASEVRPGRSGPLRLRSVVHERALPKLKHVGTFDLFHEGRQARLAGFDDALFCNRAGEVSEGSVWNIGFWDGDKVHWPTAPALPGITHRLLVAGLQAQGVECVARPLLLGDLAGFRSAFIVNAGSVGPQVRSIDDTAFVEDPDLVHLLDAAYESQPLEPV